MQMTRLRYDIGVLLKLRIAPEHIAMQAALALVPSHDVINIAGPSLMASVP